MKTAVEIRDIPQNDPMSFPDDLIGPALCNIPLNVAVLDNRGRFIAANPALLSYLNIRAEDIIDKLPTELGVPMDTIQFQEAVFWVLAKKQPKAFNLFGTIAGEKTVHLIDFIPQIGSNGHVERIFAYGHEVADYHLLQDALKDAQEQLMAAIKVMPDIFWIKGIDGRYKLCNQRFQELATIFHDNAIGKTSDEFISDEEMTRHQETDRLALESDGPVTLEVQTSKIDGEREAIFEIKKIATRNARNEITGILGIARNVTADRKLRQSLRQMAYTDALTGLPNRLAFNEELAATLEASLSSNTDCALLVMDLDHFKSINDSLGHTAGDEVLMEIARRLADAVDQRGTVFRLSGDEFALLLGDATDKRATEGLAKALNTCVSQKISVNDSDIVVNLSIGIASYPEDADCGSKLYKFADMALYDAKAKGRAGYRTFSPAMWEETERRLKLERLMAEGIEASQFETYFQGKVDLKSGKLIGAEALSRWNQPELGSIAPSDFIPLAENAGHIVAIGRNVMEQSCRMAVQCNKDQHLPFKVAVNVSAHQLVDEAYLSNLVACLTRTGCRPEWLEIEITEGVLLDDVPAVHRTLKQVSALGIAIAIDDFGTGYSALNYLQDFPIDVLKIDRTFIQDMCSNQKRLVLVKAMMAIAHGLGLTTVAEGVETQQVATLLEHLHCDLAQGFLWHRPCPADELLATLHRQRHLEQA